MLKVSLNMRSFLNGVKSRESRKLCRESGIVAGPSELNEGFSHNLNPSRTSVAYDIHEFVL